MNGEFLPISDADASLAERTYRLALAYRAYLALDQASQAEFRAALPELLLILAEDQGSVATALNRPLIEDSGEPAATLDELLTALPAILDFDATDGVTAEERAAATRAAETTERYLHGYLPRVY